MQPNLVAGLTLFSAVTLASPVPELDGMANATKTAGDNWCRSTIDTICYSGASTSWNPVRAIHPSDRFGANCVTDGERIGGNSEWDWIPGWRCYIPAHYTVSAGSQPECETRLGRC